MSGGPTAGRDHDGSHSAPHGGQGGAGRALPPSSPFGADDGSADVALSGVLSRFDRDECPLTEVVVALAEARVLVPVFATPGSDGSDPGAERTAASKVVALGAPDGRRALPVFTSVAAMSAWRAEARPVPVPAPRAALSAVEEGWSLLVVDPGGPVTALVPRPAVWALAQGRPWVPAVVDATVDRDVVDAVVTAVAGIEHVAHVGAEPGRSAEVAVALRIDSGLDRAGLDRVLAAINRALAASALIAERVDSLELRVGRAD